MENDSVPGTDSTEVVMDSADGAVEGEMVSDMALTVSS